jgi:hypothetical protein
MEKEGRPTPALPDGKGAETGFTVCSELLLFSMVILCLKSFFCPKNAL